MRASGVVTDYALFGAAAQMRYTDPVATLDADVLVAVPDENCLDALGPIYDFCRVRGYQPDGEPIRVGPLPVQFVPVFSQLTRHALAAAETAAFDGVPFRVVSAAYLAVIALGLGGAKDHARVLALLESEAASRDQVAILAGQEGLSDAWKQFSRRFLDEGR